MKKVLSLIAVLVMLAALAVPAMADTIDPEDLPSPIGGTDISGEVVDQPEYYIDVIPADVDPDEAEQIKDVTAEALGDDVNPDDVVAIEVVEVVLKETDTGAIVPPEYYDGETPIKLAFVHNDKTKKIITVLYLDPDGTWKEVEHTVDENGRVIVELDEITELAFVIEEVTPTPPTPAPTSKPGGGGKTSPQTGYNTTAWIIAGAVLLAGGVICFVLARKKNAA